MQTRIRGYYVALAGLLGLVIAGGRGDRKMSAITFQGTIGISAVMRSEGGDGTVNPPINFTTLFQQLFLPGTDPGEIEFFYDERHTAPGTLILNFGNGSQVDKRGVPISMSRVRLLAIKNNSTQAMRTCFGGMINDTIGFSETLGNAEDPIFTIQPGMVVLFLIPGNEIVAQDSPTLTFTGSGLYTTDVTVWLAGLN